jgi:hypothetical protein
MGTKKDMLETRGCVSKAECRNNKSCTDYKEPERQLNLMTIITHQTADEENTGGCRKPT